METDWRAEFEARLQRLSEAHEVLAMDLQRVAQTQLTLAEMQSRQGETLTQVVTIVSQLALSTQELSAAQQRTDRQLQNLAAQLHDVAAAQQHTEQNLNALIKIVDDLIRRDGQR